MRSSGGVVSSVAILVAPCVCFLTLCGCTPAPDQKPKEGPGEQTVSDRQPAEVAATPLESISDAPEGMPPAPKASTFAPAADLVDRIDKYVSGLEKTVAGEDTFEYVKEKIGKDANTVIVLALALGLHDESNEYRDRAGALMQAAAGLAAVADLDAARKAVAVVREAADGKRTSNLELKWGPVASLPELMLQVPPINTKLKRCVKGERFKSKAKLTAGYTAVIAAIAQGSMADLSETKNAEQVKQWFQFCIDMRDSAAALNAAIHAGDEASAAEAMKRLARSCNDCHAVFHPEAAVEK